jgi:hypothetical protein
MATAFACRSTVRPAWRVPLTTNRLLLAAVAAELAMWGMFVYVGPIADLLDQAGPSWPGFLVAVLAIPAVLAADAIQKETTRRRSR